MIYLVRHGQTDWNREDRVIGATDLPLNATGLRQAEECRKKLAATPIDLIICSPKKRAQQTAAAIVRGRDIPVVTDARIAERNFGVLEGADFRQCRIADHWVWELDLPVEGGESVREFFTRVYGFLDEVREKYRGRNVLIVAHGGVSTAFRCYFSGCIPAGPLDRMHIKNCEVVRFE